MSALNNSFPNPRQSRPACAFFGLLLAFSLFASSVRTAPQQPAADTLGSSPLTILQLNDVYTTVPIDNEGGLARVAALKKRLAAQGRTPFLVLAGDFLSSSMESAVFKGEQMVAAFNAAGLDLATLGNHEFDFGADVLLKRMAEAKWQWVVSNVVDTRDGKPIGGASAYTVRTFGRLRVGFIGLCVVSGIVLRETPPRVRFIDPLEAAATYIPMLRNERVDVIVAVTHLTFDEDRALAERFPDIDLIIGGHEHFPITAAVNRTFISKAGADARFVGRIDVDRRGSAVQRLHELVPIDASLADDPETAAVVDAYRARMSTELSAIVGTTSASLDAVEERIRTGETNLGDYVADAMRANADAEIALVNSGAIRGDRIFPAGPITKATLLEIHPFGNVICKVAVTGRTLLAALNHGVARLPAAAGQFLQVSGLSMTIARDADGRPAVMNVRVNAAPLDEARTYTVAVSDYMLLGGDGYSMLKDGRVVIEPESGRPLVAVLEEYLGVRGGIQPAVDGRINRANSSPR